MTEGPKTIEIAKCAHTKFSRMETAPTQPDCQHETSHLSAWIGVLDSIVKRHSSTPLLYSPRSAAPVCGDQSLLT